MTSLHAYADGDPLLTLVLFPFVLAFHLVTLPVAWLIGAVAARRSLGKWPRLLAATPGQFRALTLWVSAVPVVGAVSYGVVWCWKRATAPTQELVASRVPFPPQPWERAAMAPAQVPLHPLPPTMPYPVPPAALRPDITYVDPPRVGADGYVDRFSGRGSR